jgi:hypothetical protein
MVAHKVASRVVAPDCIPDGWHAWRASRFYFMEQRHEAGESDPSAPGGTRPVGCPC